MTKTYTGWHFTETRTTGRDGWPLKPVEELPGGTKLELCAVGLHACKSPRVALDYSPGPWVSRVRLEGDVLTDKDKACAARRVRLAGPVDVSRELRLFAADCAERVLPLFEAAVPGDPRPRKAIRVARQFADGEAKRQEVKAACAAACDAARAAACAAACDAARDATRAAAWDATRAATRAAACAAAWDATQAAARVAAGDAARDAESKWQERALTRRLRAALAPAGAPRRKEDSHG
jgi:hypothetical protein